MWFCVAGTCRSPGFNNIIVQHVCMQPEILHSDNIIRLQSSVVSSQGLCWEYKALMSTGCCPQSLNRGLTCVLPFFYFLLVHRVSSIPSSPILALPHDSKHFPWLRCSPVKQVRFPSRAMQNFPTQVDAAFQKHDCNPFFFLSENTAMCSTVDL